MKSREHYITQISSHTEELKKDFGVRSLCLFGSVSRNKQKEDSDVDICVEMKPKAFLVVRLKRYLENLLESPVDLVRKHKHMNPYLLREIEQDGIYVIK
ncbi:MAG: nucleotidyltransferase family protein [Segatella copri]